jgi:hypothetical protein
MISSNKRGLLTESTNGGNACQRLREPLEKLLIKNKAGWSTFFLRTAKMGDLVTASIRLSSRLVAK